MENGISVCTASMFSKFKNTDNRKVHFRNRYAIPISKPEPENREGVLFLGGGISHFMGFSPLFLKIWICGVFFGSFYAHLSG